MSLFSVLYEDLCKEIINCNGEINLLNTYIKATNLQLSLDEVENVKKAISKRFLNHFNDRWHKCQANKQDFFKKYEKWLKGKL